MQKKPTIYIHIGAMKTGTTAIQRYLYNNAVYLSDHALTIPTGQRKFRNQLAFSFLEKKPTHVHVKTHTSANDVYKEIVNEIMATPNTNYLLSSEVFFQLSIPQFCGVRLPEMLYQQLIPCSQDFSFKIIFFIRRQDRLIESIYNQIIKTHHIYNLYDRTFSDFIEEFSDYANLDLIINSWTTVFGSDNMVLVPYIEKETNSVKSLLGLLNIPYEGNQNNQGVNSSLNNFETELIRTLNHHNINKESWYVNDYLVQIIREVFPDKSKFFSYFTNDERSTFLKNYYDTNIGISNKYLNGSADWFNSGVLLQEVEPFDVTSNEIALLFSTFWNNNVSNISGKQA